MSCVSLAVVLGSLVLAHAIEDEGCSASMLAPWVPDQRDPGYWVLCLHANRTAEGYDSYEHHKKLKRTLSWRTGHFRDDIERGLKIRKSISFEDDGDTEAGVEGLVFEKQPWVLYKLHGSATVTHFLHGRKPCCPFL